MKKHLFLITLALLFSTVMLAQNIQVNIVPADAGTVVFNGDGTGSYAPGDTATIIATANTGYSFLNWTENDTLVSTSNTLTFIVTEDDRTLFANFEINSYEINATANPPDGGSLSGMGVYDHFSTCTLIATPATGFHFLNWTLNGTVVSSEETFVIQEVSSPATYVANFELNSYLVNVTADPVEGGAVEGSGTYNHGETASLNAIASTYYEFSHWNDEETDNPKVFTVVEDATFIAYFVLQLPVIDENITEPEAICSGESLELNAPSVSNIVDNTFWQLSADNSFDNPENYEGQPLDITYNGWMLRFCASNTSGITYSNAVAITVNELTPTLVGEWQVCSNEEAQYYVEGADNAICQWTTADSTIYGIGNPFTIQWNVNADTYQLSVFLTDTLTGCTASIEMEVVVTSFVTSTETLIGKSKDNVTYLLIYPNPDTLLYKYQWYYNDNPIQCSQQYLYKSVTEGGLEPGAYKVFVSFNENENGDLICGAFSPEFIVEPSRNPQLYIYPNPSKPNGQIIVINEDFEEASLSIYSMDGRLLHSQSVVGYQTVIHLDLPKGFYIAHLKNNQSSKTGSIIIE